MERSIMESGDDAVKTRIIGGYDADLLHFPWLAGLLVQIQNTGDRGLCSGSLISSTRVVTAAHCWMDDGLIGAYLEVVLGSDFIYYGGTRMWSYNVVVHPSVNVVHSINNFKVDVALVFLPNAVDFSGK